MYLIFRSQDRCPKVPWGKILTSKPVWAIIAANMAADWGLYTILISLPIYLVDIRHVDIQTVRYRLLYDKRWSIDYLDGTLVAKRELDILHDLS